MMEEQQYQNNKQKQKNGRSMFLFSIVLFMIFNLLFFTFGYYVSQYNINEKHEEFNDRISSLIDQGVMNRPLLIVNETCYYPNMTSSEKLCKYGDCMYDPYNPYFNHGSGEFYCIYSPPIKRKEAVNKAILEELEEIINNNITKG